MNLQFGLKKMTKTNFYRKKINREYSKKQFFEDLKKVILDTIPGKKHKYSNLSLELTGFYVGEYLSKRFSDFSKRRISFTFKNESYKIRIGGINGSISKCI